jgi:LemA protein
MKKGLLVVIAIIAIVVVGGIASYNSLVSSETKVEEQAANIDTQLQRRADLIPNLVNTVKGYADHETEIFTAVTEAREKLLAAGTMEEKSEANEEVSAALGRLIAIAESYPELKSDTVFTDLMDELSGTENRISYARQEYNSAVASYNKAIRIFPTVIFAKMMGFEKADMFEAESTATQVPSVEF